MAILVFEHSEHTGVGRLGVTLRDYGHRLRIIRLDRGEPLPPDLDDVDAIITCGGPQQAYDDALPWLEPQMNYLRQACDAELPIIGLCLGCQILARALGGTVEPLARAGGAAGAAALELGWHDVHLTPTGREDIIHTGIGWTSTMFHWHHDHLAELPPGGRLLASSDRCRVQAWSYGVRTYAFQHHPEVDVATIEHWIRDEPEHLQEAGISVEELMDQTHREYPAFERITNRLFESIALFLTPIERRYRGLVPDMHH